MAERVLQVNFRLNVSTADYQTLARSVAESYAQVPGLRWKVWILNEEQRTAGGIYLFEDQRAVDAFLAGGLAKAVATHPALQDVTISEFDVMPDVTAVTRGPVGAPVIA